MFIETSAKAGYNVKQVSAVLAAASPEITSPNAPPWKSDLPRPWEALQGVQRDVCCPYTAINISESTHSLRFGRIPDLAANDSDLSLIKEDSSKMLCGCGTVPSWILDNPDVAFRLKGLTHELRSWGNTGLRMVSGADSVKECGQTSQGGVWWLTMPPLYSETV